jgi:hypothetical protein
LSEAENWYVPARLTEAMNRALQTTTTPFGRVVAPLEPYRETFAIDMLWSPLSSQDANPPAAGVKRLEIPAALFEHRAILYTLDHAPFAEVRETYQRDALPSPRHP